MENNSIELIGKVTKSFEFIYDAYGEKFYALELDVKRTSGVSDILKLICSDRIIDVTKDITGMYVSATGSVRTRNDEGHLIISVFVETLDALDIEDEELYGVNDVVLIGYICKNSEVRKTPKGRMLTDQILAVNRTYNKSDYLPLIYWGRNSAYASSLEIGTCVRIYGRLQSREYVKCDETKTAYEISVQTVEVVS